MKSFLPLLSLAIIFSNCTTVYKAGQTPDDVYFSPARPAAEYVSTENRDDNQYLSNGYNEDDYLRMKVHNRRWSTLDDGYYSYNPNYYSSFNVGFSTGFYYNSPWNPYSYYTSPYNPYSYWNYSYNPYYSGFIVTSPKTPVYNGQRRFNLNSYNPPSGSSSSKGVRVYSSTNSGSTNNTNNYQNSGTNAGNFLRNVFTNSGSSNNNSSSNSGSRSSSTPSSSSSSSSSSGGSSGGHAGVRRF